ncbi:MAG: hypothetical protein EOO56_14265 [Hymenobacter sp.]|nr:MAG: hypothetical protein EOO56_14265 [Hymenobacter sp.]
MLTLNQGYLNYFIPYVGLGQLKLDATQTSYFFAFFGGLCALSNFIYFKALGAQWGRLVRRGPLST